MSMIKRWLEDKQSEWAASLFIEDGCPQEEANKYSYEDAVEHFFEGDFDLAQEAFNLGLERNN